MDNSSSQHRCRWDNSTSQRRADNASTSDDSFDTFASRRYLRNSLASDPWNGNVAQHQAQTQTNGQSNHGNVSTTPEKRVSTRKKARSKQMLHASIIDLPDVHGNDDMLKRLSSSLNKLDATENRNRANVRAQRGQESRKSAPPTTQPLSSLGIDASEEGNRSHVFSSYWDQTSLSSKKSLNHDDESDISGAMALVRSVEQTAENEEEDSKKCWNIFVEWDARIVVLCVCVFVVVVLLVLIVPPPKFGLYGGGKKYEPYVPDGEKEVADKGILTTTETTFATSQTETASNEQQQLSLAEEVVRSCNSKGQHHDTSKCQKFCEEKECCFVDLNDEHGNYRNSSNTTMQVEFCGDEMWHDCLTYAGCQPFFSL